MTTANETRDEKFKRLAESRVNKIIDGLRLLGHLSHKGNYTYTDQQVDTIFKAIQRELNTTKSKFSEGANGHKLFSL